MTNSLRGLLLASIAATAFSATAALATYPERPITLVVPFSAGGNSDVIARIAADHMGAALGQSVIIENRGGGGGSVGSTVVAGAAPDGYTLLFATAGTHSVNPSLRDVGYDPLNSFRPINAAVISSVLIVVNPQVPATNLAELIALTRGSSAYNFASGGMGTVAHVAGELYNEMTGSMMVHVPYQGAGDVINDLIAGRIQVNMNNLPTFLAHIASGALRPIALAAPERSALLPDVPTTLEGGLDLQMGSWFGIVAPAGTPDDVIARLNAAMVSMQDSAQVRERLAAVGSELSLFDTPDAFGAYMADQLDWWGRVLDNPAFR